MGNCLACAHRRPELWGFGTIESSLQPMTLGSWCINTPAPSPPVWDGVEAHVLLVSPQDQPSVVAGVLVNPLLIAGFSSLYTFLLSPLSSLCSLINNLLSDPWLIFSGVIQMNPVSCMFLCFLSQSVET